MASVAPVLIVGITGTPGHISLVTRSISLIRAGVSGDGGEFRAAPWKVIFTPVSPTTRSRTAFTCSGVSSGRMRQLTLARARGGNALVAWPPSSIVDTHDVRSCELYRASADSVAAAAASAGLATMARIAAAIRGFSRSTTPARRVKYARVT